MEFTILIDRREQRPLPIPSHVTILDPARIPAPDSTLTVPVRWRRATLTTGDYALVAPNQSVEGGFLALAERKMSQEIAGNCLSKDRTRFIACLDRLSTAAQYPFLLLEGPTATLSVCPAAFSALLRLLIPRRIALTVVNVSTPAQRRHAGYLLTASLIEAHIAGSDPDAAASLFAPALV